jgi:hypothetical protein
MFENVAGKIFFDNRDDIKTKRPVQQPAFSLST